MIVRVLVGCLCLVVVGSYPSGAPSETCGDMVPRHGPLQPQSSVSQYTVTPAMRRVVSGSKMRLMLDSPEGSAFAGFMLQARTGSSSEPLGMFTNVPDFAQIITCGNGIKNTVTHRDKTKKKSLEFEWEAPADYEGPVVFNTTFVKDGATFWVGVQSEDVQVVKRSVDDSNASFGISTTRTPVRITTTPNYSFEPEIKKESGESDAIYDNCKGSKLCFGIPDGCVDTKDCNMVTAVSVAGDEYQFEIQASTGSPKWVALGLSDDDQMGSESVMECSVEKSQKPDVYMSYNEGKSDNRRLNQLKDTLTLLNSSFANGKIYCRFKRETVTTVEGTKYDLANDQYHLLLAAGTDFGSNGVARHNLGKLASGVKQALSDTGAVGGSSDLLYRLHGAFMIASWIGAASVGIVLARYFKTTWVGSQLCGKDQWFVWHRFSMVTVWTLTCVAFILIFVQIQGWYSAQNPHAILGCVTTGLAFIQPFGAMLRPMPDSPRRPLFNWLHWLVGNSAHILAIVTIFFAVDLDKAQLPKRTDFVLIAFVAFHVVMHFVFSFLACCSERKQERMVNEFPLKDMNSSRNHLHNMDRKRDAPHSCLRKFLLAFYLVVILMFTVLLIVMVVLAPIEDHWTYKEVQKVFGSS